MPRRILDSYFSWNWIASYGSYIALLSTLFFFYLVFVSLTSKNPCLNSPWESNSGSSSLEWVVSSPPAYHTFEEMPLICETREIKKPK